VHAWHISADFSVFRNSTLGIGRSDVSTTEVMNYMRPCSTRRRKDDDCDDDDDDDDDDDEVTTTMITDKAESQKNLVNMKSS